MVQQLYGLLHDFFITHGYWALALTLLLENAGIPLPGETMLLFASFLAFENAGLNLGQSLWSPRRPVPWATIWATGLAIGAAALAASLPENIPSFR